mmetsp:Transcript_6329/g.23856  ORF Transcript_6329/g.23856 Transcript_6329/m.23856 type:complete len:456 (-) Transcript_6329:1361-2728(-)
MSSIPTLFSAPLPKRVIGLIGGIASGKSTARTLLSQNIIPKYLVNGQKHLHRQLIPEKPSIIHTTELPTTSESARSQHQTGPDPTIHLTIIDADVIGHSIYLKGTPAYHEILTHFGKFVQEGSTLLHEESLEIDRRVLGSIVFGNEDRMRELQQIVWPKIKERIQKEISLSQTVHHGGFIILEAAILLEAQWHEDIVDEIWCMSADKDVVVKRLKHRNGLTEEQSEKRLASQWTNNQREVHADVIVRTNSDEGGPLEERLEKVFLHRCRHLCLPRWGILPLWYPVVKSVIEDSKKLSIDEERHRSNLQHIRQAASETGQHLSVLLLDVPPILHDTEMHARVVNEYEAHVRDTLQSFYGPVFGVEERTRPHQFRDLEARVHVAHGQVSVEQQLRQLAKAHAESLGEISPREEQGTEGRRVVFLPHQEFSLEHVAHLKESFPNKEFQFVELHDSKSD